MLLGRCAGLSAEALDHDEKNTGFIVMSKKTGFDPERVGILGVGHLMSHLVPGFDQGSQTADYRFLLSSRNRKISTDLAQSFGLEVTEDNNDLVRRSEIVTLATPTQVAISTIANLPWERRHLLISFCLGISTSKLQEVVGPAKVVRVMPTTAGEVYESPTSVFPRDERTKRLMSLLGPVYFARDEKTFDRMCFVAAFYGWMFALFDEIVGWGCEEGLPKEVVRSMVAQAARGAASMVLEKPDTNLSDFLEEAATPGGVTALGLERLRAENAFDAWGNACELVVQRIKEFAKR